MDKQAHTFDLYLMSDGLFGDAESSHIFTQVNVKLENLPLFFLYFFISQICLQGVRINISLQTMLWFMWAQLLYAQRS